MGYVGMCIGGVDPSKRLSQFVHASMHMSKPQSRKAKVAAVLSYSCQHCWSAQSKSAEQQEHRELAVTIKNIVIPLEVEYLQDAAKQRGVSRTRLVRAVMEKVVQDELVEDILGDSGVPAEPAPARYRRFRDRDV